MVGLQIVLTGTRCLLLTFLAYLSAHSINSLVAMGLTLPPEVLYTQNQPRLSPPRPPSQRPLSSYAVVYTRDIFNSVKALTRKGETAAVRASSPFKLWGTAAHGPNLAFAILEDPTTHTQKLYREGETLAPGVALVHVAWDRVVIEQSGQRETLMLPADMSPGPRPPTPRVATSATRNTTGGIHQVASDTFQIERRAVEHAMENLTDLFKSARAVPYTDQDGIAQGFRLFSIKAESLVDRLGLKNGDIIQRVNGVELNDPGTAFSLLQDLEGLSRVQVDVLRNHDPVTLSYEID